MCGLVLNKVGKDPPQGVHLDSGLLASSSGLMSVFMVGSDERRVVTFCGGERGPFSARCGVFFNGALVPSSAPPSRVMMPF